MFKTRTFGQAKEIKTLRHKDKKTQKHKDTKTQIHKDADTTPTLYPQRGRHSPFCSSYTMRLLFLRFLMPFSFANRSHRVSGLGSGTGFSRGNSVVPGGSSACSSNNSSDTGSET